MAGEGPAALPVIDEALIVAQRLGLTETVGELLASKGWALGESGRPVEASVLLRGAVWFAEREGLVRAEFRSRMNLSAWIQMEDRQETLEVTRRGIERAQRLGLEGWVHSLLANAMEAALQLGEWDWIEVTAIELRVEEQVIPWRAATSYMVQMVAAFRGDEARVAALEDRISRMIEGHADPQLANGSQQATILVAYARGDFDPVTDDRRPDDERQRRPGPGAPRPARHRAARRGSARLARGRRRPGRCRGAGHRGRRRRDLAGRPRRGSPRTTRPSTAWRPPVITCSRRCFAGSVPCSRRTTRGRDRPHRRRRRGCGRSGRWRSLPALEPFLDPDGDPDGTDGRLTEATATV